MNIINIRIEVTNPFDRWDCFRNLGSVSGKITKFKSWELEHTYYSPLLLDTEAKWTHNTDHAGIEIGIGVLGYSVHFRIYDTRHWDDYHKQWAVYEYTHTNS